MTQKYLMSLVAALAGLALLLPASGDRAMACGPDTDCIIGERTYRIRMPEGHDGARPVGAVLYAHGYKGSAAGAMRNQALGKTLSDMGLAFIAAKSAGDDWSLPGTPSNLKSDVRVELDYFDALLADVTTRFAVDPERIMMTGFSAGGMMVWTLACERPDRFLGFAPIAGTFWAPVPDTCRGPVADIIHIHGDADRIVPLAGRPIGKAHQGDVPTALAMYARFGAFGDEGPLAAPGDQTCTERRNPDGKRLAFCQFPGGHSFRTGDLRFAWDWLK
ncbi:MAG: prolyl oligopeptidase family serine peptidase [Pseudomonadota bacterium]